MTITVRLFAVVRERAGVSVTTLELPESATVADARDALGVKYPALGDLMARLAFAVNREYVPVETVLRDGDELALIPPVSGG